MADSTKKNAETRTFVKIVDGVEVTREVTSPQSEVMATFEGFTEQAAAKPSTGGRSATSASS